MENKLKYILEDAALKKVDEFCKDNEISNEDLIQELYLFALETLSKSGNIVTDEYLGYMTTIYRYKYRPNYYLVDSATFLFKSIFENDIVLKQHIPGFNKKE